MNATYYGHQHAEAFCLMKYQSDDKTEVEWIWNSRDGVTPFCVVSRSGKMMSHVQWYLDRYLPRYHPLPGERVFVDLTEELARPRAGAMVEQKWQAGPYPMRDRYPDKEAAVEMFVREWLSEPGAPTVVDAHQAGAAGMSEERP